MFSYPIVPPQPQLGCNCSPLTAVVMSTSSRAQSPHNQFLHLCISTIFKAVYLDQFLECMQLACRICTSEAHLCAVPALACRQYKRSCICLVRSFIQPKTQLYGRHGCNLTSAPHTTDGGCSRAGSRQALRSCNCTSCCCDVCQRSLQVPQGLDASSSVQAACHANCLLVVVQSMDIVA